MIYDLSREERRHRACGKCTVHALVIVRAAILQGNLIKMRHLSVAAKQCQKPKAGWRNSFAAGSDQQSEAMLTLVYIGLATADHAAVKMPCIDATYSGCKVDGLGGAGVSCVMEN